MCQNCRTVVRFGFSLSQICRTVLSSLQPPCPNCRTVVSLGRSIQVAGPRPPKSGFGPLSPEYRLSADSLYLDGALWAPGAPPGAFWRSLDLSGLHGLPGAAWGSPGALLGFSWGSLGSRCGSLGLWGQIWIAGHFGFRLLNLFVAGCLLLVLWLALS